MQISLRREAARPISKTEMPHTLPEDPETERLRLVRRNQRMTRLVAAIQELSLARDLNGIMAIVRRAARELTGADGATFILREGDLCHYVDEEAIGPLWKGQRFPMKICISGWVMLNRRPAVIEDIYEDPRIPQDAYRPTFVKSLAMVPIRPESPIGAIGNYWATPRMPTEEEVELLQALANTTAVAMENVRVHDELEERVRCRTAELRAANEELELFVGAVSHDLGAPLRAIRGFTEFALDECGPALGQKGRSYLDRVHSGAKRMQDLVSDLLRLSNVKELELRLTKVDLSALARDILNNLAADSPDRTVDVEVEKGMMVRADPGLLRIALENLLGNAWKYSSKTPQAKIEVGTEAQPDKSTAYYVRDNGIGFNMKYVDRLFKPFQRLHRQDDFPGTGVGLTTVHRIIQRHGGKVWAESGAGQGATFYFTLSS